MDVYSTVANMGIFLPFHPFLPVPTSMTFTFYQPILHGADSLHTAPPPPCLRPPLPTVIAIRTLNVQDGLGFGLAQATWVVERVNLAIRDRKVNGP